MRLARVRTRLLGGVCLGLTAACGSTVSAVGADAPGASSNGLTAPVGVSAGDGSHSAASPAGSPGAGDLAGVGGDGAAAAGGAFGGPASSGGRLGGDGAVAGPNSGAGVDHSTAGQGVGVTATTITVGIRYITNMDAANAAVGASGIKSGDTRANFQAVIDDVNAHGGAAGRKLVPVFHAYDAQSQEPYASQDQAACADFTQDHHVAAVMGVGYTNNFLKCVLAAGAIDINSGVLLGPDKRVFDEFPYYFDAGTLSQDRMMGALVGALRRTKYFGGWNATTGAPASTPAKLGILSIDAPEWNRPLDHVLLPALRAGGQPVDNQDVVRVYNPASTADTGQTLSGIENAALRFRNDNVTHVIMLDTGGNLLGFFGKDAQAQHYYPRYGLDSGSAVQTMYDAGLVSADQLKGASGLGWFPLVDLSPQRAAGYQTAATKRCLEVIRQRTGQAVASANEQGIAAATCDQIYAFVDAANRAGPVINRDTLRGAIEGLHFAFQSALLPGAFFSLNRHDAAQDGFDLVWDGSCTCAKYVKRHAIP